MRLNADNASVRADIEDAIKEGIVVIGSAGNNNFHMVADGDPDYNNTVTVLGLGTVFYNRGSTPANSLNAINVGALSSYKNFRRSTYSNFGPLVDVFAPGDNIISSYNSNGQSDGKYGANDYYQAISGTSMASPQVTGVIACLASYKPRFNQSDAKDYLDKFSIFNDMTFDTGTGGNVPAATFDVTVVNVGFSYQATGGSDRLGSVSGGGFTVTLYVGDTINFNLSNVTSNHPFFIRTTSGLNVSTPAATGQGSTGNNTVSWTPNTAGSFKYQCAVHPGMVGDIDVIQVTNTAGTFADPSCSKDSPNLYLHAKNPREGVTGLMSEPRGLRSTSGLTFPRVSTLNRSAPGTGQVITVSVTASGINAYIFNGSDEKNKINALEGISSEEQEIYENEIISDSFITKDENTMNNVIDDQIVFEKDPEIPIIDIDFEEDDGNISLENGSSDIEIIVQGESWVEIIDDEQILLFELLQTGFYEVTGYGPFKFKIGHSPSVKIYLNGNNIDFSKTVSKYTDYAHFLYKEGVAVELFKD